MIRFGICACGGFVERAVLPMMQRVKNARATAACGGTNRQKVKDVCDKFNMKACDTFEELNSSADIEAVYIASPNVFHKDQAIAAAKSGKHILCEKPMGMNAEECREMVDACHTNGVKLGVGFCYPFAGGQQKAKELIREGAIGEVSHISLSFNMAVCSLGGYNKDTVGWRCDPKMSGGGPLMDLGPHLVNLANFLLDDKVESVMAYVRPDLTETDIELDAVATMEFSEGARASMETSFVRGNVHNYTIVGTQGKIYGWNTMNWEAGGEIHLEKGGDTQEIPFDPVEGIEEEFRQFCRAIEGNSDLLMSGEAGLHAQAVIDAIYESGRTGKRVAVI